MSISNNRFYIDDYSAERLESTFLPESWIEVDPDGQMFIHLAPSPSHPDGMWDPNTGELLYRTLGVLGLFTLGRTDQDGTQKHFGDDIVAPLVSTTTPPPTTTVPPPVNDPMVALGNWHLYALSILGGPGAVPPVWTPPSSGKYKEIEDFILAW